jgi:hypothetical protein
MKLTQTEKTQAMNLSLEEEAKIILDDIFDGDEDTKAQALSQIDFTEQDEIFNYIIEHEDHLYDLYLPVREASVSES